jgi:hypothetical protein
MTADDATRRARFRTTHPTAGARTVAAAVRPDNAPSMRTRVGGGGDGDGDAVVTTIERATTGGLAATVDDYIRNVIVADRVASTARRLVEPPAADERSASTTGTDAGTDADAGADAEPAADAATDTDTDRDTNTNTNTSTKADADTETNTNTDTS